MIIREARIEDAEALLKHAKKVYREGRNLLTSPEEFNVTVEQEVQWLKGNMEKGHLTLVAEQGSSNIVGMLNATKGSRKRVKHICMFGISIQEEYCNNGLGSKMIQKLFDWAKGDKDIEKVCLEVFAHNERAIHVYEKLGFKVEGRKERHVKFEDGTYSDELIMGKFI
ncbi:GNAT family N-acetyltransferase [Sutcliffiella horikoshii]|uniref:GNAT family N-acetyltransferase n=1 Tax=Sutcliffiella horikoshii TaxID=79883 RepID=A0A5D4TG19_9BACI|nr:GNAT family protein [Sutcliffiella horikoshii]TYS73708.1 GNAT family N-acetyltransferase [Sutcliffiella horikoshii]